VYTLDPGSLQSRHRFRRLVAAARPSLTQRWRLPSIGGLQTTDID
jgi:hypothetical protein